MGDESRRLQGKDMNELQRLAKSYRSRAEELRTLAEKDRCEQTCRMLVCVAYNYEQMAASADAIERSYHAMRLN